MRSARRLALQAAAIGTRVAVAASGVQIRERTLVLLCIATWLTIALIAVLANPPLGHDEAQYAVAARESRSPWLYLSPGTVAIARVGVAFGASDWMVRVVPALLGTGVVFATWWLGRLTGGPDMVAGRAEFFTPTPGVGVGGWAAAVIVGAHSLVLRNSELIGDLPAAACLVAGVAVLVRELAVRDRASWWLIAAAPAFAAAFYLRYGSAPVIATAGAGALVLWWRCIVARPGPAIAATFAFGALLVPYAIHSLTTTGSILGVLRFSASVPYHAYPGEGLMTYVTSNPLMFYGFLVGPTMVIGLVGMAWRRNRTRLYLALLAVAQIVMLGLQTRAQPRYVCFATILLVVLGVDALVHSRAARYHLIGKAFVAMAALGAAIAAAVLCAHLVRMRAPLVLALETVHRDAAGRPCAIAALAVPQLMWRSRCAILLASPWTRWPPDRRRYIVALPFSKLDVAAVPGGATAIALPPSMPRVWQIAE